MRIFSTTCPRRPLLAVAMLGALANLAQPAHAGAPIELASSQLIGLGFEDLMKVRITSVSKKDEQLFTTPAAISVITADDIRRSGVTNIPDAIRLAPGVEVAQVDAHTWAITARGFNATTAAKLLVLVDGRSVYTPLFSGVFWDVQDILLTDIDRIEVIRGPGAAVWGANAVNGVINIIRKEAKDTQGGELRVAVGSEDREMNAIRYGGKLGDAGHYRAYAKFRERDDSRATSSANENDSAHYTSGGFRTDWKLQESDDLTLQGDVYNGDEGQTSSISDLSGSLSRPHHAQTEVDGGNVSSSWTHGFESGASAKVQFYYDRTDRAIPQLWAEKLDTFDFDAQHQFKFGDRQSIVWGGGWRVYRDVTDNTFAVGWLPSHKTINIANLFVQDEIRLARTVHLTLGSKFEHHDYTGLETQPNARLAWTPNDTNTVWASAARAARSPSRLDREAHISGLIPTAPPIEIQLLGTEGFESEKLTAYELGYRVQPRTNLLVDLAGFFNSYNRLRSLEPQAPFVNPGPPLRIVAPFPIGNKMNGETYGFELASEWKAFDWWRIKGNYTYFHIRLDPDDDSADNRSVRELDTSPSHQIGLRSSWDLPRHFELDASSRYIDYLPTLGVKSYVTTDARLGWTGIPNLDLDLIAQNLLKPRHVEYVQANEIEENIFGRATWHF